MKRTISAMIAATAAGAVLALTGCAVSAGHSANTSTPPGVRIGTHVAVPVVSYGPDSTSSPDPGTTLPAVAAPSATMSEHEALLGAQEYLSTQAFSKAGLIDQLSSKYGSGFSKADATWAVNRVHADWNAEAVKSAREYLSTQAFSRQGLIDQLSSPYGSQFTVAQATYATDKVGL